MAAEQVCSSRSPRLLAWGIRHTETSFADGLRYIHQAERIEAGSWRDVAVQGTDHPLHPLAIAAMHRLIWAARARPRGKEPRSGLSFACTVLLVIPTYLLGTRAFRRRRRRGWHACW